MRWVLNKWKKDEMVRWEGNDWGEVFEVNNRVIVWRRIKIKEVIDIEDLI